MSRRTTPGPVVVIVLLAVLGVVGAALFFGVRAGTPETVDERDVVQTPPGPARALERRGPAGAAAAPAKNSGHTDPRAPAGDEDEGAADLPQDAPSPEQARALADNEDAADDDFDDDETTPPPPRDDGPPPSGVLSKEAVMAGIRAVVPQIKECFEDALKEDPSLAGRVLLDFDIEAEDGKGVVRRGEVKEESETRSPFFEACVLQKVAGAEFDAPAGGGRVRVSYPLTFDPGGGFGGDGPQGKGDDEGEANE